MQSWDIKSLSKSKNLRNPAKDNSNDASTGYLLNDSTTKEQRRHIWYM
jgi:hypothetical protein